MSLGTPQWNPGDVLDEKYRILARMSSGGMGTIYKAQHVYLDKLFAVKVLKEELLHDAEIRERFMSEARLACKIKHPHVVKVYDIGLVGQTPYIVYEYVSGITLKTYNEAYGSGDLAGLLRLAVEVLEGLDALHQGGIIHRDMSPDNIMVIISDREKKAKIIDLGIALIKSAQKDEVKAEAYLGKIKYSSPEQIMCDPADPVDERSDLYSMGIVLYEMIARKPPFEGTTLPQYIHKHLYTTPKSLREILPDIPEALDRAVLKMMGKRKEERQANAREVIADLAAIGKTLAAQAPPSPQAAPPAPSGGIPPAKGASFYHKPQITRREKAAKPRGSGPAAAVVVGAVLAVLLLILMWRVFR